MENSATTRERISAFADGEVSTEDALPTLSILREPLHHRTWDLYHQIGDTLRSESMAAPLSQDFSLRLAAKLDAEPPLLAPSHANSRIQQGQLRLNNQRKWFMPAGLAAAAAAVFAFVMAPNFLSGTDAVPADTAPSFAGVPPSHGTILAEAMQTREPSTTAAVSSEAAQAEDISQYIEVHQRSHTSLYGSARLVQPASLITTAEK